MDSMRGGCSTLLKELPKVLGTSSDVRSSLLAVQALASRVPDLVF